MKIKLLVTCLLGLASATALAQKGELSTAEKEFNNYDGLKYQQALAGRAQESLKKAKESIDKAAANEKTATLPQTYALKGAIYSSLALGDSSSASMPLFTSAEDAVKKAIAADTKGEQKKVIELAQGNLAQYMQNEGIKAFNAKKFDVAYKSFDYARSVMPEDTNMVFNTGLAALNAGNYDAAITNYNKLVSIDKYPSRLARYNDLVSIYLEKKDTVNALKTLGDAVAKFPTNADLARRDIVLNIQAGKQQEVLTKVNSAIANDPKNKMLYYFGGLTYGQAAQNAENAAKGTKVAATKAKLTAEKNQNLAKATEMYKKALEIDPNFFEANLNLGYVLIKPGIDMFNEANNSNAKQAAYDAMMAKANAQFDLAKPYLLKAVELDPKSADALENLRTYYLGKKDAVKAAEIKKQMDALSK